MSKIKRPLVLVIAGVDSCGGAGITADVLTIHDHGAWALPCVSSLTAQSLKQVKTVTAAEAKLVAETIDLAVSDAESPIAAVKIGLITSSAVLEVVFKALDTKLKGVPVIWDPVLNATAGKLGSADLKANLRRILKHTTVFTPNLPEAMELAGWDLSRLSGEGIEKLARFFVYNGAKAVIVKGGHTLSDKDSTDYYASADCTFAMTLPKKKGKGAHGGGCAFSSAIAALVANGHSLADAAVLAKAYVYRGTVEPQVVSTEARPPLAHHGLIGDLKYLPAIKEEGFPEEAGPFAPCPFNMGVYPVVGDVDQLELMLAIGVRTIQLRIKDPKDPELEEKVKRACFLGRVYHARVFIDDYADLAVKYQAYGVHLGMEDLRSADLIEIKEAGLHLGVSTHGMFELTKALALKPSYIALGHIFPTRSKVMPSKPQGVDRLAHQVNMLKGVIPTVAIGGIKEHHLDDILGTGVGAVAVITALTQATDPIASVHRWVIRCTNGGDEC